MAFGIFRHFLLGIVCIALVISGATMISAKPPPIDCNWACELQPQETDYNIKCSRRCQENGYKKGGSCTKGGCCCIKDDNGNEK
ncbi:hypothetical protein RIF29_19839 [Crotalaria pallida]|uniref:LCR n=1 Tax=Crotalaria pallida TaxID=3830 RepID=A0AAN9I6W5_CROPI